MWGNITGAVGQAIQKVKKLQNELESQLDAAVSAEVDNVVNPYHQQKIESIGTAETALEISPAADDSSPEVPIIRKEDTKLSSSDSTSQKEQVGFDDIDISEDKPVKFVTKRPGKGKKSSIVDTAANDISSSVPEVSPHAAASRITELESQLTLKTSEIESSLKISATRITELEAELHNKDRDLADEKSKYIEIDAELRSKNSEIEALNASIASEAKQLTMKTLELTALETSFASERHELHDKIKEYEVKNAGAGSGSEKNSNNELNKTKKELEAEKKNSAKQLQEAQLAHASELEKEQLRLTDEFNTVRHELDNRVLDLERALASITDEKERSLSSLQESFQNERNEFIRRIEDLARSVANRDELLQQQRQETAQASDGKGGDILSDTALHQQRTFELEKSELIRRVEDFESRYRQEQTQRQKFETDFMEKEKEAVSFKERLERLKEKASKQLENVKKRCEGELQTAKTEHDAVVTSLRAEVTTATEGVDAAVRDAVDAVKLEAAETLDRATQEVADTWGAQVKTLEASIETLHRELSETKAKLTVVQVPTPVETPALTTRVEELTGALTERETSIITLTEQLNAQNKVIDSLKEVVAQRERALESSTVKMTETYQQLEDAQRKIVDLSTEIAEKDSKLRATQASAAGEGELRKLVAKLQEEGKEKDEKLAGFIAEGQTLARKQSEMEKVVRATKKEMKDKETEITKLKETREQLNKAISELQELLRKNESETNNTSKTLSAMQAVSQASTDKLSRLEAEIATKADELASQRRALDASWAENSDLKRSVAELRADRDDLRKQIGEGTSKVMETESSRRDIEQREAVLRATNKQLQDSLQRQMQEAVSREERLRDELNEVRKRWQEAVSSRETLSSELSSATAPLLRQISSLQESLRSKSESWQSIESSLTERALRSESVAEVAEHRKNLIEEQVVELKQQVSTLSSKVNDAQLTILSNEGLAERLRRVELSSAERVTELESRLSMEAGQRQSLQASLRELELRHKIDQQEMRDSVELAVKQGEVKAVQYKAEADRLRGELDSERAKLQGLLGPGGKGTNRKAILQMKQDHQQQQMGLGNNDSGDDQATSTATGAGVTSSSSGGGSRGGARFNLMSAGAMLPSGEASYAATERLQIQMQQRDEDTRALGTQLHQLQASRDALLEEVSYLSGKNAQLEEDAASVPRLREELLATRKRIDVLLVMVGEKEEEYEALLGDMKEVKNLYRAQMEDLLERITASSPTSTTTTSGTGTMINKYKGANNNDKGANRAFVGFRGSAVQTMS